MHKKNNWSLKIYYKRQNIFYTLGKQEFIF